jgi:hypothetical protein
MGSQGVAVSYVEVLFGAGHYNELGNGTKGWVELIHRVQIRGMAVS